MIDVGDHNIGQVDLEQVDLLPQDQRQKQVERAREHLEIELEVDQPQLRGPTHRPEVSRRPGALSQLDRPDAHRSPHVMQGVGRDRPGLIRAGSQNALKLRLVGAQLGVALADRCQVVDDGVGDRLLEGSVAGPSANSASSASTLDPADRGEDLEQVGDPRLVGAASDLRPSR